MPIWNGLLFRNANTSTVLWENCAIEASLRQYIGNYFEAAANDANYFDTFDAICLQTNNTMTSDQKNAALLWASWKSLVTLMASLLSNGADANVCDEEGRTSLHLACCNANSACVKILLNHGAKVNCFDKQKLAAPLFCVVASGVGTESESVVDLLLNAGADINLGEFGF